MKSRRIIPGALSFVLVFAAVSLQAADLRDKLPAESILYLEFTGSDANRETFEKTPISRMYSSPEVRQTLASSVAALERLIVEKAVEEGPPREAVERIRDGLRVLWHKGFALDVLEVGMTENGPNVAALLVANAGEDAAKLVAAVEECLALAGLPPAAAETIEGMTLKALPPLGPGAPPIRYGVVEGYFVAAVGADTPTRFASALAGKAPTLATHVSMTKAFEKLGSGGPYVFYIHFDAEAALTQARSVFGAMTGAQSLPPPVEQFLAATGLDGVRSVSFASRVVDGAFEHAYFAACPAPRKGYFKAIAQTPLADDDLIWAPKDATLAMAVNLNPVEMFDVFVSSPADPEIQESIREGIAEVEAALDLRLRDDLLAAFGDGMMFFDAPSQAGLIATGAILVLVTPDEDRARKALERLGAALCSWIQSEFEAPAAVRTAKLGEHDVHYLTVPGKPIPVAPAWAIRDKRVVFGLSPQALKVTLDRVASKDVRAKSLLANEDFQQARRQLPEKLVGLTYADSRTTLRRAYPFVLLGMTLGAQMAAPYVPDVDLAALPDVNMFCEPLFGDIFGVSADDSGISYVARGPLPVPVGILAAAQLNTSALAISVLLPSLSRARTLSKRLVSAANLKQLGVHCHIYAQEHDGVLPPDLDTLVAEGFPEQLLIAPSHGGPERSYTYIPGHTVESSARWVVAYEDYEGMSDEGANVLFVDARVEFVRPLEEVHQLVAETRAALAEKKAADQPEP
jgi:hypothetical protein